MGKSIDTYCNECNEEFAITKFDCENIGQGIEKTFFTCPNCNKEYVDFYTDVEIRKSRADIALQQRKLSVIQTLKSKQKTLKKIEQMQEMNKYKMNALRKRIENC